jgi:predicted nucleotidyltransferase component of viral defense system
MKEYIRQLIGAQQNTLLKRSIVREYLQSRVLQILQEEGAFLNLAFLGGTSLRFLYSIPRYSEGIDFSKLTSRNLEFDDLLKGIIKGFELENYKIGIKKCKEKTVLSAFIKFPSLLYELDLSPYQDENFSIKLEIDINPPQGANTEVTLIRKYILLNILHYDKASLFAGKIHAILSRKYTKGRDLFDLIWMLANPEWPIPNFILLDNALKQTNWAGPEINPGNWKDIISSHLMVINWKKAIEDILPFLERESEKYLLTLDNCLNLLQKFKYKNSS